MAKKDRTGNRKTRDQRKQFKVLELGYYLIVTDTEATERCFFTGLHQAMPEDVRNKLVIKVIETKTRTMILEQERYGKNYQKLTVELANQLGKELVNLDFNIATLNPNQYTYTHTSDGLVRKPGSVGIGEKISAVINFSDEFCFVFFKKH